MEKVFPSKFQWGIIFPSTSSQMKIYKKITQIENRFDYWEEVSYLEVYILIRGKGQRKILQFGKDMFIRGKGNIFCESKLFSCAKGKWFLLDRDLFPCQQLKAFFLFSCQLGKGFPEMCSNRTVIVLSSSCTKGICFLLPLWSYGGVLEVHIPTKNCFHSLLLHYVK